MKISFKNPFANINQWKILRFGYKALILCAVAIVIANFIFLYWYFYRPVTEARITVTLTYDAIYQKINKTLFDKISKKLEERKQPTADIIPIRDPFRTQ